MYSPLYRSMRRFAWKGGRDLQRNLAYLEATQWMHPEDLEQRQTQLLRDLIGYAAQFSPFYEQRLREIGLESGDITSIESIADLPPMTRGGLQANHQTIESTDPAVGSTFLQATGGTTGEPMQFSIDRSMSWWSAAITVRGRSWYGVQPGDRQAYLWGAPVDLPNGDFRSTAKSFLKRRRWHNAVRLDEASLDEFASTLRRWQPKLLRAYPAALTVFAQHLQKRNIADIKPMLVETTAETLSPAQEELFWEVFQAPVANCYACREMHDVAYPCPERRLHVSEPFIVEILDDSGRRLQEGVGNVTVTSLEQRATPFIRYQLGDLAEIDSKPCPCGRSMPVISQLLGRKEDMIVLSDGSRAWGGSLNSVFLDMAEVKRYQVRQTEPGVLDVRIELRANVGDGWHHNVARKVDEYLGNRTTTTVTVVDSIEFTAAGKTRNIVSAL